MPLEYTLKSRKMILLENGNNVENVSIHEATPSVWNLQKAFSLRTIKVCRFEIIDGVKYVYCIKHAYEFLLREQVGFLRPFFDACVNVFLVYLCTKFKTLCCVRSKQR